MPALFLEILIPTLLIAGIIGFFVTAYVLFLVTKKIFKIDKSSYKISMLITLWTVILGIIIFIICLALSSAINISFLSNILSIIINFIILHFLLKKYYQTSLKRNLFIYIVFIIINGIATVIVSLAIIMPVRSLVIEPFYTKGANMEPTFHENDYLIINKFDKNFQRADIIVFRYPKDPSQYFIKRIIGLPGEEVSFANGKILINGQALDESVYLAKGMQTEAIGTQEFKLGADEYFVVGDNRAASLDSRRFGPINKNLIVGKYWFAPPSIMPSIIKNFYETSL
ncbi:MAG: signal peptidase I [Candidatus Parcubacteria bacterium]|nr:signal peptidase I [Candidatus Parcubacteria bacterium]